MSLFAAIALAASASVQPPSEPMITAPAPAPPAAMVRELRTPGADAPTGLLRVNATAMATPKRAPQGGDFPWLVAAFGQRPDRPQMDLRFRVYSQDSNERFEPAQGVARMLIRLWKLNVDRMRLDHNEQYGNRVVDVYLRRDGKAGGEQRFDVEVVNGRSINVNTITIFDLPSFTDPLEMAREVAHEYGHASLPPVGGYTDPEDWANGLLGERLFLTWVRDEMKAGRLTPADAMGASLEQVEAYVARHVEPAVRRIRENGPDAAALARRDRAGMEAYVAHTLAAERMLPEGAFVRSLLLNTENQADAVPSAAAMAAGEVPRWTLDARGWRGRRMWAPVGQGRLTGARVVERRAGWARLEVQADEVVVTNPEPVD